MSRLAQLSLLAAGTTIGLVSAAVLSAWGPGAPATVRTETLTERLAERAQPVQATTAGIDPENEAALGRLLGDLEGKRVVYVGETHDRYDHHLNQLAIIRGLHERGVDLAIGLEPFQEPFQASLDQYVAGEIPEKALLKRTEYYERWRYDFRLYRDILVYAREHKIPLVALNAPSELVAKVSKAGLDSLGAEDRARLPEDLSAPQPGYAERLRPIFEAHGRSSEERFRRFVEVQMLWDEHMARVARDYLIANPGSTLVILAGSGHVAYPDAIPERLARLLPNDHAVVVTGSAESFDDGAYDHLLAERSIPLERPGRMGLAMTIEDDAVRVSSVRPEGPAERAGLRPGDRLLSVAGEEIREVHDVTLALLDRQPGEEVWVEVLREGDSAGGTRLSQPITLL